MEQRNLATFPNELLMQILSHIRGQSHLAKIARISKQFKALVELLLYRHISLDITYSAKDLRNTRIVNPYTHTTIPSFMRFDRLIDTFSVHPNLAKQVDTLSLRVHRRLWYKLFATDSRLLKLLPDLRTLSLSPPPFHSVIPYNNWALTSLRLDFSHVTDHYDERSDWLQAGIPLQMIARYLSLPKLRKVQVEKILFTSYFDETSHLLSGSPVEDLRFLKCCKCRGDERVVAAFLRSIKCLKRFVFEVSARTTVPDPSTGVFGLALSEHQETIEELAFATSEGAPVIRWVLGPFTQWSGLKRLAVPSYTILGRSSNSVNLHEILPPLLEELQIEHLTGYSNQTWPQVAEKDLEDMQRLADNKNLCVPQLSHVVWWYQKPTDSPTDHPACPIRSYLDGLIKIFFAFDEVGVKFVWVTEAFFKDTPVGKRLYEWQE